MIHLPDCRRIENPKSLTRRYVKEYAYNLYDCVGALRSCDEPNTLTKLLHQPANFRVEAVVHELLHLKVPNHGKLFKALLRAYLASSGVGVSYRA